MYHLLAVQPWLSYGISKAQTKPTDKPLSDYEPEKSNDRSKKISSFVRINPGSDIVVTLI